MALDDEKAASIMKLTKRLPSSDGEMRKMGKLYTPGQIALALGISEAEVLTILKRLGIKPINAPEKQKPKRNPKHDDPEL